MYIVFYTQTCACATIFILAGVYAGAHTIDPSNQNPKDQLQGPNPLMIPTPKTLGIKMAEARDPKWGDELVV